MSFERISLATEDRQELSRKVVDRKKIEIVPEGYRILFKKQIHKLNRRIYNDENDDVCIIIDKYDDKGNKVLHATYSLDENGNKVLNSKYDFEYNNNKEIFLTVFFVIYFSVSQRSCLSSFAFFPQTPVYRQTCSFL